MLKKVGRKELRHFGVLRHGRLNVVVVFVDIDVGIGIGVVVVGISVGGSC